MRSGSASWPAVGGGLGALGLVIACASGPFTTSTVDGRTRLTHRDLGYSIAEPPFATGPGWQLAEFASSDLAYRDQHGTATSLASNCPRARASAENLARHVTIGTPRSDRVASGPIEQSGVEGWTQTFDTLQGDVRVRVKAVTLMASGCVYDWLLVSPGEAAFAETEPVFDAWIESFVPPPDDGAGEAVDSPVVATGDGRTQESVP